ncbi:hypothetical protein PGT21_030547 [Puccinia graminis f. sp. tritici]|uniref:Uncharacterized protein n=1 Tax=Puccinia graminis f. sp. tritici TaxID=56615 RepID=A0A5B0M0D8_PUCGR|nr:hypothetical protein PGT21_030547 [Puccinia graminis f. sp. tritici]
MGMSPSLEKLQSPITQSRALQGSTSDSCRLIESTSWLKTSPLPLTGMEGWQQHLPITDQPAIHPLHGLLAAEHAGSARYSSLPAYSLSINTESLMTRPLSPSSSSSPHYFCYLLTAACLQSSNKTVDKPSLCYLEQLANIPTVAFNSITAFHRCFPSLLIFTLSRELTSSLFTIPPYYHSLLPFLSIPVRIPSFSNNPAIGTHGKLTNIS